MADMPMLQTMHEKEVRKVSLKLKAVTMLEDGASWNPGHLSDFADTVRLQATHLRGGCVQALHSQGANSAWTWAV